MPGNTRPIRAAALLFLAATPARAAQTLVSLTFDDGSAQQASAGQLLGQHGMRGTFYVNSANIGTSGFYLTLDQLRQLASEGHEVAGHTLTHQDLTQVSADQARHQVCDDRAQLMQWGFNPVSFAYPYGAHNPSVEAIVKGCGYGSARITGLVSCPGCPMAESIPPPDPLAIRCPESLKSYTPLDAIKKYVTDAEQGGGGWLILVFHRICDACGTYSTPPATFSAFLDWLQPRAAQGTVVRTVRDVMGGAPPPPAPGVSVPVVSALIPSSAPEDASPFTLTVLGANFSVGSTVRWNGTDLATVFVSPSRLDAAVPASDLAAPGLDSVSVFSPGAGLSSPRSFQVTTPQPGQIQDASLDLARVYPNPWRSDKHAALPVTIDRLPPGSRVRLFTLSGRFVKTIDSSGGSGHWDLTNDAGEAVASGYYFFVIDDGRGNERRGGLAVIR